MTAVDFAAFVDQLATASGDAILPFFRTTLSVENKSRGEGFDPVTVADRSAEAAMRALIRKNFPDHGIVGEEYGAEQTDAYCMLAAGHADLVIECGLKPYDVIPLIPIIAGAGGIITDWNGGPAKNGGRIVCAGDARVHKAAMTLLNG